MYRFLRPVAAAQAPTDDPALRRYVRSYLILRIVVGALGIAVPFLLVLVDGVLLDGSPFLRPSLSDYYYSGAREVFVGSLSAIGVFLITYKVAELNLDNTLSLLAGLAVAVVALFPTEPSDSTTSLTPLQRELGVDSVGTFHFGAAGVFIFSLGVISFLFGKREGARPPHGRRSPAFWRNYHWACAAVIGIAFVWSAVTAHWHVGPSRALLYGEAAAVWAFGASWLWKGLEIDLLRSGSGGA